MSRLVTIDFSGIGESVKFTGIHFFSHSSYKSHYTRRPLGKLHNMQICIICEGCDLWATLQLTYYVNCKVAHKSHPSNLFEFSSKILIVLQLLDATIAIVDDS